MTAAAQPLAVLLALAGSGCYAVAAVTQQRVATRLPSERAFDPAVLVRRARRPAWLAGLAAVVAGFALQAAALGLGRLVVIEPVLASGLLFALVLAAWRDKRPLRPAEWAATLAVVAGLAVFLTAGQPAGGQRTASAVALGLAVAAAGGLIGLCAILAGRFPDSRRALLLGVGGGVAAGVTDALIKSVAVLAAGHLLGLFGDARLYLLIVVGLLTYTIQQNGYRAGGLAAFLPAFTVTEPVVGSLLGLVIYHERLSDGPGQIAVELAACAAAIWGIARLARSPIVSAALPVAGPASPALAGLALPAGPPAVGDADEGLLVASATVTPALGPAEHRAPADPGEQPGGSRRRRWPRVRPRGRQRPGR
jgi:drug/metabolite transporter (DMT)-like permease